MDSRCFARVWRRAKRHAGAARRCEPERGQRLEENDTAENTNRAAPVGTARLNARILSNGHARVKGIRDVLPDPSKCSWSEVCACASARETLPNGADDVIPEPLDVLLDACRVFLHFPHERGIRVSGQVRADVQQGSLRRRLEEKGCGAGV